MNVKKAVSEQVIQKQILDYLAQVGAFCFKTITCNKRGIPDICAVYKGVPLFIEVKKHKNCKVAPLQLYQIRKIKEAGGIAKIAYSIDDAKEIVYNIDNKNKQE